MPSLMDAIRLEGGSCQPKARTRTYGASDLDESRSLPLVKFAHEALASSNLADLDKVR